MLSTRWLSKLILLALLAILTFSGELILIPIFLEKADAQDIYNYTEITQNHQNPQKNLQILLEKGKKLYDKGKFLEAISVLEQAAQIFQSQGNRIKQEIPPQRDGEAMVTELSSAPRNPFRVIALSNISLAYKQLGEYQQALSYITQSRKLLASKPNFNNYQENLNLFAQILDIQANLQLELGKPYLALDNWKQVTLIYERLNLTSEEIRSLINQNLALQALGRYRQARKILEELLPEIKKQPASVLKATALRSLGDVQLHLGEIDASLDNLQQSYRVAKKIESPPQIAASLLSLGNAKRAKGNKVRYTEGFQSTANFEKTTPLLYGSKPTSAETRKLYQQAVQTYEKALAISTSPTIQTKAQLNQLGVFIELKEFSKASKLYSQLQSKINNLPNSETSIQAQINLAKNLLCLKQVSPLNAPEWKDIAQILARAIKQAETLEDVQSNHLQRIQAYVYGVLANIYLKTQNLTDAQQLTKKAVDLALSIDAKDIAYLWQWQLGYILEQQENLTEAIDYYSQAVDNLNDLRGDLLILNRDLQFSFRDDVEPVYRQLVDLLLQPSNAKNVTENNVTQNNISQNNLKQARNVIEALQLKEIENYFQEACFQAKPEIIDTVVDKTDTTAAVIYPIILQNRLEIVLKLPLQSHFNHYTIPIEANEFESTLEELQNKLTQPEEINRVQKLSGKVYEWLIQPLEADLQKNDIETLVFVLDGTLRNIPMAVLYDKKATEKQSKYLIEKYAIVLTSGLQMLEPEPLKTKKNNALMAGVSKKRFVENKEFNALKNVPIELQTIQSQINSTKSTTKKLLNQSFTDINLEKQIESAKYTIVHIATHGNFSSNLEETYILTWDKLLKLKDFDKLFQINTKTDSQAIQLLVLSACETAEGDKRAALGLSGIAIRAGARSTLATLWAVEDESTAELMSQFYQELQNNNLNKAKALQQAQINLLRNQKHKLPLIWAPYVLVGNWL